MGHWVWNGLVAVGMMASVTGWGQGAPVRVSGGTMAGQLLERTDPVYPPIARAAKVTGAVVLRATIDETGHVRNLQVVGGPEMLRQAAMEAVRRWVYKPYLLNGEATAVDTVVTVNFQIGGGGDGKNGLSPETPPGRTTGDDGAAPARSVTPMITNTFCGSPRMGGEAYHQRISGGVMQGLLKKKVAPIYPEADASGAVVMMVCVDAAGAVEKVQVVSGPGPLRDAAGRAVSQWRYQPYLLNGEAVPVSTTVTVMFSR